MWLWNQWFNPDSFYSYCAVVPVISGLLIYQNIKLKNISFKSMAFPVLFLAFMFPLPTWVTDSASHYLKYQAAGIATVVLNVLQVHSIQNGSVIVMDRGQVVVNDACSGIRAIISLLAMGSVFAYLMESTRARKWILMALVMPIAIIANAMRIVFLSLITEFWGAAHTKGIVHLMAGLFIYGLSFIILMLISKALSYQSSSIKSKRSFYESDFSVICHDDDGANVCKSQ